MGEDIRCGVPRPGTVVEVPIAHDGREAQGFWVGDSQGHRARRPIANISAVLAPACYREHASTAGSGSAAGPGHVTLYVGDEDAQAALAEVERLGGKTIQSPIEVPGGVTFCSVRGPRGPRWWDSS